MTKLTKLPKKAKIVHGGFTPQKKGRTVPPVEKKALGAKGCYFHGLG